MESNLTPEYIKFIDERGNLNTLVQQVIDRVQYLPGFLENLQTLINDYEDPFEEVPIELEDTAVLDGTAEIIRTTQTGDLLEKRLKAAYYKQS